MRVRRLEAIPEDTRQLGERLLKPTDVMRVIGEQLSEFVTDADFTDLYPAKGQPAIAPGLLAMVTVLQWVEAISDRQAAGLVVTRVDWKYALRLPLEYMGFDYSVLSEFRGRLIEHHAEQRVFEKLLTALKGIGLVKARGKQRTDGLAVLGATDRLTRLELVYETLRVTLMAMRQAHAAWFNQMIPDRLVEEYGERGEQERWVKERGEKGQAEVKRRAQQVGRDGQWVLKLTSTPDTPKAIVELEAVRVLRVVWEQQYTTQPVTGNASSGEGDSSQPRETMLTLREKMVSKGMDTINTPHDPDVRYSQKRGSDWEGYKVQVTETVDDEMPHIITDVQTTPAPASDFDMITPIQETLARRDVVPAQQIVDMGYMSGQNIAESATRGVDLIGPARPDGSKQAHIDGGVTLSQFDIQYDQQRAHCPQGHSSVKWHLSSDNDHPTIDISFDGATCASCPLVSKCVVRTTPPGGKPLGRTLQLRPYYTHLAQQRVRQTTESFKDLYRRRSGVEATLSMGVRAHGLRRSRYIGLRKTALQHFFIASACNLKRSARWIAGYRPVNRGRRPKSMQRNQNRQTVVS